MNVPDLSKNIHLSWRAGFGPLAEEIPQLHQDSPQKRFQRMLKESMKRPDYLGVADNSVDGLVQGILQEGRMQELTREKKEEFRRRSREGIRSLNLRWLETMVHSEAQLREKMAFFWHGHFACRSLNIFFQQELLDIIRKHALGNFAELLIEVSRSAAMLAFLNNQQNRKQHPNENFARELMELFTLGRGNYSEQDVKEAARAFTGWGFDAGGRFVFRNQLHDSGTKKFLGREGRFQGMDILDILLAERQTARFITRKIYRFLVNEQPDEARVAVLAEAFYQRGYDIQGLLKDICTSDWFYSSTQRANRIKSPIELLVGIRRILPMRVEQAEMQILIQKLLGQVLFYPPNVAGWPGGEHWIDSSSLMYRLLLPQVLDGRTALRARPKADDDADMGRQGRQYFEQQQEAVQIDWPVYIDQFRMVPKEELKSKIAAVLCMGQAPDMGLAERYADRSSRAAYIQSMTIHLMSMPEYQLC